MILIRNDIKLSKAQLSKIIQSGGFLGALLGKLAGPLMKVGVPLAKNVLAPLSTMSSASTIDGATQRKMCGKGAVRAEKGITLVISNEDMDDTIRIIKSLENSDVLIDGVSETVKHEVKQQGGGFLGMLLATLGVSMLRSILPGKIVVRAGKGTMRVGRVYNMHNNFYFRSIL